MSKASFFHEYFLRSRIYFTCIVVVFLLVGIKPLFGSVTLSGAYPSTGNKSYPTLREAFASLNTYRTSQSGRDIIIKVTSDTDESTSQAILSSGNWTSLVIYPTTTCTIYGTRNSSTASAMIALNGADNVTIDGRINRTGYIGLSIENRSTSTTRSIMALQLYGDATLNTIQYCNIKGTRGIASNVLGIISFGSGTNTDNHIDNCNISNYNTTGLTDTRRLYAITNATGTNTNNSITNCTIYDTWLTNASSSSIYLTAGNNWTISGNSFYDTGFSSLSGTATYSAIKVVNTSITNYTISDNFIGGNSAQAAGTLSMGSSSAGTTSFQPIYLNVGTGGSVSVANNVIKNIQYKSLSLLPFTGIFVEAGDVTLSGNTIGDAAAISNFSIVNDNPYSGSATSYGFYLNSAGTLSVLNNSLSQLLFGATNVELAHNFYGIYKTNKSGSLTISGNTVGHNTTSESIKLTCEAATYSPQALYGIYSKGTGNVLITGNTVANLKNYTTNINDWAAATTTGIYSDAGATIVSGNTIHDLTIASCNTLSSSSTPSVCGLYLVGTSASKTVSGNFVYNLSNSSGTICQSVVFGLYFNGASAETNVVERNFIHNLSAVNASSVVSGIYVAGGATTYSNNIVTLTNSSTNHNSLYGVYENGNSTFNFFHNTLYIGGSVSASTNSSALFISTNSLTRDIRDNLFYNARNSGGSDYAISYSGTGYANLTSDYNDFYVSSTSGVVGYYSGNMTFAELKTATGKDANSFNIDPLFGSMGGDLATDYKINLPIYGVYAGITTDFSGETRSAYTLGAWDYFSIQVWHDGAYGSTYRNLKTAFDRINDGTWTGDITIKVIGNTVETASAVLNASGGTSNYSRVLIYPEASDLVISGNFDGPLVHLNGADNLYVNGSVFQNNTAASLVFQNNYTGSDASVIRFSESAQNNSINYAVIKGNTASASHGLVEFLTSTTGTGNSADTIANSLISGTGATATTRPYNALYSYGTSGKENSEIALIGNQFSNFLNPSNSSNGVLIGSYSNAFTISGNSFYETASFSSSAAVAYNAINIDNTGGGGFILTNNHIGGNSALSTGIWTKVGNNNEFAAIRLNVNATPRTSVQGNVIRGFNYTNTANASWYGFYLTSGGVDLGTVSGNRLGESTGVNSIYVTNTTDLGALYGIYINSTDFVNCQNNVLSSISVGLPTLSSTLGASIYGIYKTAAAGSLTVANNILGSIATESSFTGRSQSTSAIQNVVGIYSAGTGSTLISSNILSNINNATISTQNALTRGIWTTSGSNTIENNTIQKISTLNAQGNNYDNATLIGIFQGCETAGTTQIVRGNNVNNMKNLSAVKIEMNGIFFKSPTTGNNEVSRNFVHSFYITSTDQAYLHGISLNSGTFTCSNNIVYLGSNITTGCFIWGIWSNSSSSYNIWNNTVYLSGLATTGSSNSYAYRDLSSHNSSNPCDIRNNIFWNDRKNTATISHYSIYLNSTANYTLDYNDYQYYQKFGMIGGVDYSSLSAWQSVSGSVLDDHSLNVDPLLTNLGGVSPSDYQTGTTLSGTPIASVTQDFGYVVRSTTQPTIGAWEYNASPVEVWSSGVFRESFSNLRLAFNAINEGVWTGDLTVKINSNVIETATAVLYESGHLGSIGTSNYSRVHVIPTRTDIQVRGTLATPLIELNGADNVVFDGRIDGTGASNNLTLLNEDISSSASTFCFINSAEGDSIEYCTLKGLSTGAQNGIVHFSTSTSGSGNDNNVLFGNKITVVESTQNYRVLNGIYSEGSTSAVNDGNKLIDNDIFNVWSPSASSAAIHIGAYSSEYTITGNSIYDESSLVPAGSYTYQGIKLNNASGDGFVVNSNYIGGKSVQAQGGALTIGTTVTGQNASLQPIFINVGSDVETFVQGNTVANIAFTSPNTQPFAGIQVDAGLVNMGGVTGNVVGSNSGTGSIVLTGMSAASTSYGISVNSSATVTISNNAIGAIQTIGSNNYGHSFYGIYKSAVGGQLNVSNNTIGSVATANSIYAVSTSLQNSQLVCGVYSLGTGVLNLDGNTIANLSNATTRSHADNSIYGIYYNGLVAVPSIMQRNLIYNLSLACIEITALNRMAGVYLAGGSITLSNNIFWIGNGVTNNYSVYGIYDAGVLDQHNYFYHNTVYITGSAYSSWAASSTYAYFKSTDLGYTDVRNNIFINNFGTTSNVSHYAVGIVGLSHLTMDANDLLRSGSFSSLYNTQTITELGSWRTSTGKDLNSYSLAPFTYPSTFTASAFRPYVDLYGTNVTVGYDYVFNPRNATQPTIGAWERANKWKGNLSIDFNNPGNWTFSMVPSNYDNVIFDDVPQRPCTLDQNRFVTDVVNKQSVYRLVLNGYRLTVRGSFIFSNGAQVDASSTGSSVEFNNLNTTQVIPSGAFYTDNVYDFVVNNPQNVVVNGTINLTHQLTTTSGKLNASNVGTTFNYNGASAQTIEAGQFLNDEAYNIGINNPLGVALNSNLKVNSNLVIATNSNLTLKEAIGLTVLGTLTNGAGTSGLLLKSSALGTASLVHNTSNISATVQRYIDGASLAWHFLSSPVSNQAIHTSNWISSGAYGDGTGYDMYTWYEPTNCWVYNLNSDLETTWQVANPSLNFIPGKGYLYAVEALNPTKSFVGLLNNGAITQAVSNSTSASIDLRGFNFMGNPYPSSIDWRNNAGYTRNMLVSNGGGHWIWVWSTLNNNYGVYNSADVDTIGTNNVTAFISPMQSFFVEAATSGNFVFNNAARSHYEASSWLRSMKSERSYSSAAIKNLRLSVSGQSGGDEIKLSFGFEENGPGAHKMFSPVKDAPSLYLNVSGESFSTRRLTDTNANKYVPLNFKAEVAGSYTFNANFDEAEFGVVYLQDRKTGTITDLNDVDSYSFVASTNDNLNRFVLHFGEVVPLIDAIKPNVWVENGQVYVYLENMIGDYKVRVFNVQGQLLYDAKLSGGEQRNWSLFAKGQYLVEVSSGSNVHTVKVVR